MSDIIDLLERLGQDARLRHATRPEIEQNLQDANVSLDVRTAFTTGDQRQLESLLGLDGNVCCIIYMPREMPDAEESPGRVNEPVPNEEEWVPA
jgi:hypothetical protein